MSRAFVPKSPLLTAGALLVLLASACGPSGGDDLDMGTSGDGVDTVEALVAVELDAEALTMPLGTGSRPMASAVFDSGRREDVSTIATWASDDPATASVGNGDLAGGAVTARAVGATTIHVSYEGQEASLEVTVTDAELFDLRVTPGLQNAVFGSEGVQCEAFAVYSDGTRVDVTELADWTSSDDRIGVVGDVSYEEWLAAEMSGMPIEYRPKGFFYMYEWNYDVDPPQMRIPGTATVTATLSGTAATATVIVQEDTLESIRVEPVQPILLGGSRPIRAHGFYGSGRGRDVTANATWSSSDPSIISVATDESGVLMATAHAAGSVIVEACIDAICGTREVAVNAAVVTEVVIVSDQPHIAMGALTRLKAVARYGDGREYDVSWYATWELSDPSLVAVEDEASGAGVAGRFDGAFEQSYGLRGTGLGPLTVTVTVQTGLATTMAAERHFAVRAPQLVSLDILPAETTFPVFDSARFRAVGTYEDGTVRDVSTNAVWSVDDTTILTAPGVGPTGGVVSGLAGGTATVNATFQGFGDTATATVADDIESLAIVAVHPETGEAYPAPHRTRTLVKFIGRATLASGTVVDIPLDGYEWDIPTVTRPTGTWPALTPVGDGIFHVNFTVAANLTATRVMEDGSTLSASYVMNAQLDTVEELLVDPPNPTAHIDPDDIFTADSIVAQEQYFRIYALYASGRRVEVTDAALDVSVTPRANVALGQNPEAVSLPGEVLRTSYWEYVDLNAGFESGAGTTHPEFVAEDRVRPSVPVRRIHAPVDMIGDFDLTFGYEGVTATATAYFEPSDFDIRLMGVPPDLSEFEGSATPAEPPPPLIISGMDDLLIKDLDPAYRSALFAMEARARARAATLDAATVRAGLEASGTAARIGEAETELLMAELTSALASTEVRERAAVMLELMDLLGTPADERTEQETVAVAWIGQAVHDARVRTAQSALDEYTRWNGDPWSYVPPEGVHYITPVPGPNSLNWSFTSPDPPDLLAVAESGVAPELVAGAVGGVAAATASAIVIALASSAISSGVALTGTVGSVMGAIMPFSVGVAGGVTTLAVSAAGAVTIILAAVVITTMETIRVIENAQLPSKLREIYAGALAAPVPDADVLAATEGGLQTCIGAILINTF